MHFAPITAGVAVADVFVGFDAQPDRSISPECELTYTRMRGVCGHLRYRLLLGVVRANRPFERQRRDVALAAIRRRLLPGFFRLLSSASA